MQSIKDVRRIHSGGAQQSVLVYLVATMIEPKNRASICFVHTAISVLLVWISFRHDLLARAHEHVFTKQASRLLQTPMRARLYFSLH